VSKRFNAALYLHLGCVEIWRFALTTPLLSITRTPGELLRPKICEAAQAIQIPIAIQFIASVGDANTGFSATVVVAFFPRELYLSRLP
jgi:hypothetical protein